VVANDLLYYVQNNMYRAIRNLENKMVFDRVDMVSYVTFIAETILLECSENNLCITLDLIDNI